MPVKPISLFCLATASFCMVSPHWGMRVGYWKRFRENIKLHDRERQALNIISNVYGSDKFNHHHRLLVNYPKSKRSHENHKRKCTTTLAGMDPDHQGHISCWAPHDLSGFRQVTQGQSHKILTYIKYCDTGLISYKRLFV